MYFWFLILLFPVALLLFMLFMERYEKPLTRSAPEREVEKFLNEASVSEIESYVARSERPSGGRARPANPEPKHRS